MERIELPKVISGENIQSALKKEIENYSKICIISGKQSLEKMESTLKDILKGKEVIRVWYGGECSENNIENCIEKIKNKGIDLVIGIGGGKALDTSKAVADKLSIDIITVPTVAATCACYTALSVLYKEDGSFDKLYFMNKQVKTILIDMKVIYEAPKKYILAGIGDTLAKYYEVFLKTEGLELNFKSMFGKKISELCREMIIQYSEKALEPSETISEEFKKIVNCIIVITGQVAILIDQPYNGAIAHSVCYGLTRVEEVEENALHGSIVAFGILIQLLIENKIDEYEKVKKMYEKIGLPTKITDLCKIESFNEKIDEIVEGTLSSPNLEGLNIELKKESLEKFLKI